MVKYYAVQYSPHGSIAYCFTNRNTRAAWIGLDPLHDTIRATRYAAGHRFINEMFDSAPAEGVTLPEGATCALREKTRGC